MASSEMILQLHSCKFPLLFPVIPVLFGHVRFLYDLSERIEFDMDSVLLPTFVCYDEHLCDHLITDLSTWKLDPVATLTK